MVFFPPPIVCCALECTLTRCVTVAERSPSSTFLLTVHLLFNLLQHDWYFSVFKRFRPQSQRPSKSDLLVGYGKNVKVPPVFPCLLGIIRHHIWLTRNKAWFDKVIPHYPTVLSRVKSALRCVIRVQQRHCLPANFSDFWLASGGVGSLSAGDINVFVAEFRD